MGIAEPLISARDGKRAATAPFVEDMAWGYVIHPLGVQVSAHWETASRFVGLILVLAAYGQWLVPAAAFGGDALVAKTVLSFLLGLAGATLYWTGSRDRVPEIHVDLTRREIRVAQQNPHARMRVLAAIPMGRVESVCLSGQSDGSGPARLFLRLRGSRRVLRLARGDEADLLGLHRRLCDDLRPVAERVNRRLAEDIPFRSCRTA